jgi:hypothetical protein
MSGPPKTASNRSGQNRAPEFCCASKSRTVIDHRVGIAKSAKSTPRPRAVPARIEDLVLQLTIRHVRINLPFTISSVHRTASAIAPRALPCANPQMIFISRLQVLQCPTDDCCAKLEKAAVDNARNQLRSRIEYDLGHTIRELVKVPPAHAHKESS